MYWARSCKPAVSHIEKTDYAVSTHRSHGHYLGKGGDLNKMIAEIYGKQAAKKVMVALCIG